MPAATACCWPASPNAEHVFRPPGHTHPCQRAARAAAGSGPRPQRPPRAGSVGRCCGRKRRRCSAPPTAPSRVAPGPCNASAGRPPREQCGPCRRQRPGHSLLAHSACPAAPRPRRAPPRAAGAACRPQPGRWRPRACPADASAAACVRAARQPPAPALRRGCPAGPRPRGRRQAPRQARRTAWGTGKRRTAASARSRGSACSRAPRPSWRSLGRWPRRWARAPAAPRRRQGHRPPQQCLESSDP
mmetsp:Transcript_31551/g.90561  ORF Transcript_31551/g.90561 Transcript_31551/m.90561 type:complete len:245 (-) Transcript_31551:272-1006(-)